MESLLGARRAAFPLVPKAPRAPLTTCNVGGDLLLGLARIHAGARARSPAARYTALTLPPLPLPVLVALVVLAVAAGLWVGARAGRRLSAAPEEGESRDRAKPIGARAREAATRGFIRVWRWNRDRKKKQRQ